MDVLREFREDPLPPSGVDVARAVRLGRRRRRARTGLAAIGVVAVVAAGVMTAPRFLPGGGPSHVDSAEAATEPLTCASPGPLPAYVAPSADDGAPTEFAILRHWVDVESVTGYRIKHYSTSRFWQQLELTNPSGDSTIEITLYARDGQPVFPSEPGTAPAPIDPTTGEPTDPVGIAAAYWLPGRQGVAQFEVARLGWHWAPGAWAFVAAADTSNYDGAYNAQPKTAERIGELRAIARQAASAVHIGAGSLATAPFTMPVPDCTRLVATHLLSSTKSDGQPFARLTLTFAPEGYEESRNPLLGRGGVPTVQVTADSGATPADKPGSASNEVDGHPAYIGGDFLVVHGVDGFALELTAPGGTPAVVALFRTITIVPGANHTPATWTDTPITS